MSLKGKVLLVFSLVTFFLSLAISLKREDCDKLLYTTDKCVQDVFVVGQTTVAIPQSDAEMDVYCKKFQNVTVPCIKRFAVNCLTPFSRTIFTVGYSLGVKQLKRICNTPEGRKEWLEHIPCFKPEQVQIVHHYLDVVTMYMEEVAKSVPVDKVIPWICCAYFTVFEKARDELATVCPRPKTVDFFLNIVKSVATDLVDIGCGKYSAPTSCRQLLPEAMALFDELSDPEKIKAASPGYSPVVPLVAIMKKLDSSL